MEQNLDNGDYKNGEKDRDKVKDRYREKDRDNENDRDKYEVNMTARYKIFSFKEKLIILRKYLKRSRMIKVIVFIILVNIIFGFFFAEYEGIPFYLGLYWITDTITNTGTGLSPPHHELTWYLTTILMWLGLGVTLIFVENVYIRIMEQSGRNVKIKFNNHILILGWSPKIRNFLHNLSGLGVHHDYVLIADLQERPFDLPEVVKFIRGNPVEERVLILAGAKQAQQVIIVMNNDSDAIMCAMTVQSINDKVKLTVNILYSENIKHLKRIGVQEIICDEELTGRALKESFYHNLGKEVHD
ncbi:MAG: potassium channel family protein [Promethearchaeota archaeon]